MRAAVLLAALVGALAMVLSCPGATAFAADRTPDFYPMTMFDAAATGRSDSPVHGRTIRWTWTDGPMKGVTQEHVFYHDGTLDWRVIEGPDKGRSNRENREKRYEAVAVSKSVYTVSYRSESGYTLTVILNLKDGTMVGFASGAKDWYSGKGTFTTVE